MRVLHCAVAVLSMVLGLSALTRDTDRGKNYLMYVGTYTTGESKGIYVFRYNTASGQIASLGLAAETANPSFLAVAPNGKFLYAVNELQNYKGEKTGTVTAFAIDHKTGKLMRLNEVATRGEDPCYISVDKTGHYVLVANYTSGNIAAFPIQKDGSLGEVSSFVQHHGNGPNHERQEGPHAHWIETTADNRFAVVADLGLDKLLVYRFDATNGSFTPNKPAAADLPPGEGPRHVAFSADQKFAYSVNELRSTVTAFSYDSANGVLKPQQTLSTLPKDFSGANDAAEIHIHPNGKYLYASNRGHDSIAEFSIDKNTGHLALLNNFSTEGKTPRNFEIDPDGSHLLVANQDTGNIVVFGIDPTTGRATEVHAEEIKVPAPVCITFVADERSGTTRK